MLTRLRQRDSTERQLRRALKLGRHEPMPDSLPYRSMLQGPGPLEELWVRFSLEQAAGEDGALASRIIYDIDEDAWPYAGGGRSRLASARKNAIEHAARPSCFRALQRLAVRSLLAEVGDHLLRRHPAQESANLSLTSALVNLIGVEGRELATGGRLWVQAVERDAAWSRPRLAGFVSGAMTAQAAQALDDGGAEHLPTDLAWATRGALEWVDQTLQGAPLSPFDDHDVRECRDLLAWRNQALMVCDALHTGIDDAREIQHITDQIDQLAVELGLPRRQTSLLPASTCAALSMTGSSPACSSLGHAVWGVGAWIDPTVAMSAQDYGTSTDYKGRPRDRRLCRVMAHELIHTTQTDFEEAWEARVGMADTERLLMLGLMEGATEILAQHMMGNPGEGWAPHWPRRVSYERCVKIVDELAALARPDDPAAQIAWVAQLSSQPTPSLIDWVAEQTGLTLAQLVGTHGIAVHSDLGRCYSGWLDDS